MRWTRLMAAVLCLGWVVGCTLPQPQALAESHSKAAQVEGLLHSMTLDEKLCQLFFITPEPLTRGGLVKAMTQKLRSGLEAFPVGGIVLFADNIQSGKQLTALLSGLQQAAMQKRGIGLLLGVDEEGGGVARVANKLKLKAKTPAAGVLGKDGSPEAAYQAGVQIGTYLEDYGFTLDFAPVADVRTDLDDTEIRSRAFSDDPQIVADMTARFVQGLEEQGVLSVLKHFPGHGSAVGNAHDGRSISTRSVTQWEACDWLPFRAGIDAGARVVMTSHQTAAVVDNQSPASLSYRITTELLREKLGFDGVVITDALRMDAIADFYSSGEACVRAILAGADMLLTPKNFTNALEGLREAVDTGRLSEERIDQSVRRILMLKQEAGLLAPSV